MLPDIRVTINVETHYMKPPIDILEKANRNTFLIVLQKLANILEPIVKTAIEQLASLK